MYIWQTADWPNFAWDDTRLKPQLDRLRQLQGRLLGRADTTDEVLSLEMDALIQNAIRSSEIEGESLDVASVRSSVARHLGVEQAGFAGKPTAESEAMTRLLVTATRDWQHPVTLDTLCQWQAEIFPQQQDFPVGTLRDEQPMHVMSGRLDRPTIHFTAPPRNILDTEMARFLDWFNHPPAGLDTLLRAGIAHLWLLTLHPFADGNGRVTRALTDRALAQDEQQSIRLYALSEAIMNNRNNYYLILESTQKGGLDITRWLYWFLHTLEEAIHLALLRIERILKKASFWRKHQNCVLNQRQIKVLNRLLDNAGSEFDEGIATRHYQAIARTSKATATRDLADLLAKGCLQQLPGGGRSSRYRVSSP